VVTSPRQTSELALEDAVVPACFAGLRAHAALVMRQAPSRARASRRAGRTDIMVMGNPGGG
jgi:hypothetical protein